MYVCTIIMHTMGQLFKVWSLLWYISHFQLLGSTIAIMATYFMATYFMAYKTTFLVLILLHKTTNTQVSRLTVVSCMIITKSLFMVKQSYPFYLPNLFLSYLRWWFSSVSVVDELNLILCTKPISWSGLSKNHCFDICFVATYELTLGIYERLRPKFSNRQQSQYTLDNSKIMTQFSTYVSWYLLWPKIDAFLKNCLKSSKISCLLICQVSCVKANR